MFYIYKKIKMYRILTAIFTGTDWTTCRRGYTMVHDIWIIQLGMDLKILVVVDADGELVGLNTNTMRSFLSSL